MRLTVRVLPLDVEEAGPYTAEALAAFQQRSFSIPVDADDTFERVWRKIEERYTRNYLAPQHAAFFGIRKLQDGWNCDIDLTDTVGDLFSEQAANDRGIKVFPSFVDRQHSLPPTSNLRPNPHKRVRDASEEAANKRRRNRSTDLPMPSVESDTAARRSLPFRSSRPSQGSVALMGTARHGQPEFTSHIKSESPELGVRREPLSRLKKPAHSAYGLSPTTPSRPTPKAPRRRAGSPVVSIPSSSRPRSSGNVMRQHQGPSSGDTRHQQTMQAMFPNGVNDSLNSVFDGPSTPTSDGASQDYSHLTKKNLASELKNRGLRVYEGGRRKEDMLRRLIEHDRYMSRPTWSAKQPTVNGKNTRTPRERTQTRVAPSSTTPRPTEPKLAQTDESSPSPVAPEPRERAGSLIPRSVDEQVAEPPVQVSASPEHASEPLEQVPEPPEQASEPPAQVSEPQLPEPILVESDSPENHSESDDATKSNSARSTPVASRVPPAQWLAKSPSPIQVDSDTESRASTPAGSLKDLDDSSSSSESGEERRSDKGSPYLPTSAQPPQSSTLHVPAATQSSPTRVAASQPLPKQMSSRVNTWFSSAPQPLLPSPVKKTPSSASPAKSVNTKRMIRPGTFLGLKELLKNTRESAARSRVSMSKMDDLAKVNTKKLPAGLGEDESSDSSSSSDDEE